MSSSKDLVSLEDLKATISVYIESLKLEWMDQAYPPGTIYQSDRPTRPEELFGVGTWERISGRFLLAATDGGVWRQLHS